MSINMLVIDDEPGMCWAIGKALREEGYQVDAANNGIDGLALLEAQKADVILLDVKMAGMSGLEVLERIRENWPDLPVIIMTGYGSMQIALDAVQRGATGYIIKPFQMVDLKAMVRKVLVDKLKG